MLYKFHLLSINKRAKIIHLHKLMLNFNLKQKVIPLFMDLTQICNNLF